MAAEIVTDAWSADRAALVRDDPALEGIAGNAHEHVCHDGGFYVHEHDFPGPHRHRYGCESPDCNHVSRRT